MIEFFSSWVKTLGLTIVIVSILEMLLPNNKNKKYIRMVMGLYVLFTIVSPFISNKKNVNFEDINLENYGTTQTSSSLNQMSMNQRLQELYEEELEKDVTKKLKDKGYEVNSCKVNVQISDNEEQTMIKKIKVKVTKKEKTEGIQNIEDQIVNGIQKIKPIDVSIKRQDGNENKAETTEAIDKTDIQNIKKFLIDEYEVSEKCLEIN